MIRPAWLAPAAAVLLLWGCNDAGGAPAAPPALDFRSDAGTYVWRLDGATLALSAADGVGPPAIALRCAGEDRLVLQTRLFAIEPVSPPLTLRAGDLAVEGPARRVTIGDRPGLEAQGAVPDGWAGALSGAAQVSLRYGDQGVETPGPGRALAEAWGRACEAAG